MRDTLSEQPVVEVTSDGQHVTLVCRACPDRRRLPREDLAIRYGVPAFVDEHAGCGPVALRLPDASSLTPPRAAVLA